VAFAMPTMAIALNAETDGVFAALQRFVLLPLFLFGGAFYPLSQLPTVVQWAAQAFPLWHGVAVARGLTTGGLTWSTALGHLAYVVAWVVVGCVVSTRRLATRLCP
jgi:lipooligosaccharide transport system permease protein